MSKWRKGMDFQKGIKFGSVEEFLDFLPDDQRGICEALREIVLETVPDLKEKLSYNVPFYTRHSRMAFIWPAAIPWGGTKMEGVTLGFPRGHMMSDPEGVFVGQKTKQVRQVVFTDLAELRADWIRSYLLEAMVVDEEVWREKNK